MIMPRRVQGYNAITRGLIAVGADPYGAPFARDAIRGG